MAEISAADVKKLRDETGAGMMDCKRALADASGDFDKARVLLRERGLASSEKRKGREAKEGLVHAYLHAPDPGLPPRIGVLVEVSTETDFVAKTPEIKEIAQAIALQIASMKPLYVSPEEIPEDVLETERSLAAKKVEGKPEKVVQQASDGAVRKFVEAYCLLEQPFIRDEKGKLKVGEMLAEFASKTGENIGVRRFVRYEVAESLD